MNVAEAILAQGKDEALAVLCKQTEVTYGELRRQVGQVSNHLLARGHRKGDRIGLWSENSPFFIRAYLGIIHAGLVAVPFQTELLRDAFWKIIRDAGISDVLVSARSVRRLQAWVDNSPVNLLVETEWERHAAEKPAALPSIEPRSDLAALMFTSGSTGEPKGVMVTHRNIECNTRDIIAYLGIRPEDRVMAVLPFH